MPPDELSRLQDDAAAAADNIIARLDGLDAASQGLWPRWKGGAGDGSATTMKTGRRAPGVGRQQAKAPTQRRRPLAQVAASHANRPRSAAAAGSRKMAPPSQKQPARRRRRQARAAPASDVNAAAPEKESFASAVDQLRHRVGQLSSQLDHGAAAAEESELGRSPSARPKSVRQAKSPAARRRARSASPAGGRRRGGGGGASSARSATPLPARRCGDTRGAILLDGLLQSDQRGLRAAAAQARAGTAAFALPVCAKKDCTQNGSAGDRSGFSANASQERFGNVGLSNGSVGGRLFRALAVVEDLKRQRDADRCSIRHLHRSLEFEREKVAAYKEKATLATRLQRQLEEARTSLELAAEIRDEQAEILAMSRSVLPGLTDRYL